jgi:serine/threonine-protein kinase RsbW
MSSAVTDNERIVLSLPPNAAYVTSARLTAASIANRIGFDVDEIEDVKTAVSEACIFIIKKSEGRNAPFKIEFFVSGASMEINFTSEENADFAVTDKDLGILMIRASMDSFSIEGGDGVKMRLVKKHKITRFD